LFARCCFEENIREKFKFCLQISGRCTGNDILKAVNDCFTAEYVSWTNCLGICTDRDAALTAHKRKAFMLKYSKVLAT
jgi:hypothetical protein